MNAPPLNLTTPFSRWLETASLLSLVNEHSALARKVTDPCERQVAERFPGSDSAAEMARAKADVEAIWSAISRRFPAYIVRQERLGRERREHEERVRSGVASFAGRSAGLRPEPLRVSALRAAAANAGSCGDA